MATFRVHSSALHDPNLPVDAATENAISYFYLIFFLVVLMIIAREEFRKCFSFYLKDSNRIQFKNSNHVPLDLGLCFYWMDLIK